MEKVRSMLSNSGLTKSFLEEVVRIDFQLINHSPTNALDGGIPENVWFGKDSCYNHLTYFGCEAYMHIYKEKRYKLDEK